ncbi:F-box domain-containing protein [Histoplasma capsulatum var. duboisii H88]|uniref:F-box domain-containing protein n=3 Tax=Ajellomyces capsulatus TaxID=5037 RepID=A0A8A1LU95_AJEC8|nr:F-box domain-containing protein [Histoplasma capsulatum var. duboisii H88]
MRLLIKTIPRGFEITSLPQDIFLMILSYLCYIDVTHCRRVSRSWNAAFGNPFNLYTFLKWTFPFAREVRRYHQEKLLDNEHGIPPHDNYWRELFDNISARYFHLHVGRPQSIERYKIWPNYTQNIRTGSRLFPVPPWEAHSSHSMSKPDRVFDDCFWTYESGLIAFVSYDDMCILLLDLETSKTFPVPFDIVHRVIRRIRLQHRLLVIEWAEADAFHWLNSLDSVHRHFASSFDISAVSPSVGWDVTFRNEWKIMFLGHPLSDRDRFYSSHNETHYVLYTWQPNRSLYTADEDAPIESLFVWNISEPSDYKPSADPSSLHKPSSSCPFVVAKFNFRDLDFYSVRQRGAPKMIRLDINSETNVLDITECTGPGCEIDPINTSSYPSAQITSIPFLSHGPSWRRALEFPIPPYRGNTSMYNRPFLRGSYLWPATISEAIDEEAQVLFSLQTSILNHEDCESTQHLQVKIQAPHSDNRYSVLEPRLLHEIAFKGFIQGDERIIIGENDMQELVILRFDR